MLHAAESQAERAAASLADQEHGGAHNLLQRQSRREASATKTMPRSASPSFLCLHAGC